MGIEFRPTNKHRGPMPDMTREFVTAIQTNQTAVGGITAVDVCSTRIAVVSVGGRYCAFDDTRTPGQIEI
jgi:glutamate dehydrogenase/leucine dehydrogenase